MPKSPLILATWHRKPMSADSLFKPTKDAFNEEWMEYFKSSKLPEALPIKFGIIGPGGISSKFVQAVNFSNQMWKDALALPAKKDALKITAFGVRDSYNIYQLASKQKAYVESRKGQEDRFAGDVAGHEAWANEADAWMTATKLIASKKVDIVYISASTTAKKDYALKCLEGGKSIIVEKPFMKANDVAEIAQKAKEKGLLFMDGTMFAHSPRLLHLRKHVPTKYLLQTEGSFTLYRPWCEDTAAGKAHADSRVDPKLEPHGALGDLGWYNIRFALWAYNWELPETVHCIPSVNNGVPLQASVFMSWENKDGNAKLPRRSSNFTCSFVTGEGQRQSFLLGDYEEFDVSGIVSTDQKKQYLVEVEDFIVASNPAITNPTPQSIKKTTFAWGQGPWAILKKSENITTEEKFGETNCMANLPDVVLWVSNFARMHTMRVLDPEETHTRDSLADIASQTPTKDITTTLTVPMFSNHPKHFRNISAGMKAASYQTQLVLDAACESFKDGHERVYNKKEKKYVCKPRVMVTGNGEIVRTKEDLAAANQGCSCTIM
ncbi:unnamed protein product [Amoebophrya sp. A25]|nr:unnamed protein product [Amoebophrya sp. A25]|eukprot:GSA25T00022370001.1